MGKRNYTLSPKMCKISLSARLGGQNKLLLNCDTFSLCENYCDKSYFIRHFCISFPFITNGTLFLVTKRRQITFAK